MMIQQFEIKDCNKKVFSIGPWGNLIGFATQQIRAFNAINEIQKHYTKPNGLKNKKIAVVGAGIAGVTAMAALSKISSNIEITLFEKEFRILNLQSNASHRFIHPNFNMWPRKLNFSSMTDFPCLNWYAGRADEIIARLRKEFENEFMKRISNKFFNTAVQSFEIEKDSNKVELSYKNITDGSDEVSDQFDIVIFATGFGAEKDIDKVKAPDYWEFDLFAPQFHGKSTKKIISGNGDGGMIDTLRACCQKDDFWSLPLGLIAYCRDDMHWRPKSLRWLPDDLKLERYEDGTTQKENSLREILNMDDCDHGELIKQHFKEFQTGDRDFEPKVFVRSFLHDERDEPFVELRGGSAEPYGRSAFIIGLTYYCIQCVSPDLLKYEHIGDGEDSRSANLAELIEESESTVSIRHGAGDKPVELIARESGVPGAALADLQNESIAGLLDLYTTANESRDRNWYNSAKNIIIDFYCEYFGFCKTFVLALEKGEIGYFYRYIIDEASIEIIEKGLENAARKLGGMEHGFFGLPIYFSTPKVLAGASM